MWKKIDKIKIADTVMTGFIILVITILLHFAVIDINSKEEEPSIPHDYHIIYDDEKKILIVPNEYHFKTDEKGTTILTK